MENYSIRVEWTAVSPHIETMLGLYEAHLVHRT